MSINTIKTDDTEYVRADSIKAADGNIKIVVADRGFVYVGVCEEIDGYLKLTSAKNIRYWGTKNGLGELVNGPLSGTKLDSVGSLRIPSRAVILIIDVDQEAWKL